MADLSALAAGTAGALDRPLFRALVKGQQVQIWSESRKSWEHGEVLQKIDRGFLGIADFLLYGSRDSILVRYGDPAREKWVSAARVAECVRLGGVGEAGMGASHALSSPRTK